MQDTPSTLSDESREDALLERYLALIREMGIDPNAPPTSPPTTAHVPNQLRDLVRDEVKRASLVKSLTRRSEAGGTFEFRLLPQDMKSRVLNPNESNAKAMTQRHNSHLISAQFISLVDQIAQSSDGNLREKYGDLQRLAQWFGFFILPYSQENMYNRLDARYPSGFPEYAVTEGIANHPDPDHWMHGKKMRGADCHIHLPDIAPDAQPVNEPLQSTDEIIDTDWVKNVMEKEPHRIANVDDIQCIRDLSHLGLASHTLRAALDDILDRVNKDRPVGSEITYITAEIATLQGIVTPDGKEIRLVRDLQLPLLHNGRSDYVFEHFCHDRWTPFTTACIRRNRLHPLILKDTKGQTYEYQIIADWWRKYSTRTC